MNPARLLIAIIVAAPISLSAEEPTANREKCEAAFSEQLKSCVMIGTFTIDGKLDETPKPERYEIESVKKVAGDLWTFNTRIKYGDIDTRLPITVPVVWAGDTPMVSLTNMSLPGLGEAFSARVIFHDNRYAGTWQHGNVGGHMFGVIKKNKATAKPVN